MAGQFHSAGALLSALWNLSGDALAEMVGGQLLARGATSFALLSGDALAEMVGGQLLARGATSFAMLSANVVDSSIFFLALEEKTCGAQREGKNQQQ